MDASIISQKREVLKNAMVELCKRAKDDSELCQKIKDRGFWERLFSNNARDLSMAEMAQVDLIDGVLNAVQGVMDVVKDGQERERLFVSVLDEMRSSVDELRSELCEDVSKLVRAVLKENVEIERLTSSVSSMSDAASSNVATRKCVTLMKDYLQTASSVDGVEFCSILKRIVTEEFLDKEIALRSEDKSVLSQELADVIKGTLKYDQGYGDEDVPIKDIVERELEKLSSEGDAYAKYRDELICLIDELVSHKDEVDPRGRSIRKLTEVKNRLLESQFEIALIGEFQGGKSTTFNALCGGREISPRGLGTGGVKTSAAVITAQNIAGDETRNGMREWAEIKWLSRDDLLSRIAYALDLEEGAALPSIDSLETHLKKAWKGLSSDDDDGPDKLRVATLQLRLLKSKEFDALTSQTVVAIDEFQKFVQFPKDWEMRWGENSTSPDFSIDEILFAALDSVLVRIHSEYLQRLGCRITDCPGLFVSKWDTDRALEVMSRSNAVWYLLNGNKEMDKDQKRVLQSIRQAGWHSKCFFTLNVRGDEKSTENILRANVAKIKDAKLNVENRVFKYNAAVAFRLAQIECVQRGAFSSHDREILAVESVDRKTRREDVLAKFAEGGGTSCIAAIRQQIYKLLVPTGYFLPEHATMSDKELSDDLEAFSGIKNIICALERKIVSHRASAILLGDSGSGARLCERVLGTLQGNKKAEEEATPKKLAEAEKQLEHDKKSFIRFKNSVSEKFLFLEENTRPDEEFLDDFYGRAFKGIHDEVRDFAIAETVKEWKRGYLTKTRLKHVVTKRIKDQFERVFKLNLDAYGKNIAVTNIYKKEIEERIRRSWKDLKEQWDEMEKDNPHFEGLCPDEGVVDVVISPFGSSIDQNIEVPSYFLESLRNFGDWIASWFGKKRVDTKTYIRNYFSEKAPIGVALETMKDSCAKSLQFKAFFAQARLKNKEKIDAAMKDLEKEFVERIKKEECEMAEADSVRQQKADEAKRVREKLIEPRITRIKDFMARVEASYGK